MHSWIIYKNSPFVDKNLSDNKCEYRFCSRCFYSTIFDSELNIPICYIPDCDDLFQENAIRKEIADTHTWKEIEPYVSSGPCYNLSCTKCGIIAHIERNVPVCESTCNEYIIKKIIE